MESVKKLREICQKPVKKKDDLTLATRLSRSFSIYITKFCILIGITADQMTYFFHLCILVTGVLFMFGGYWYTLIGVILLVFIEVLDCVDGELARYYKTASINGKYLDTVLHYVLYPFVIFGLSFGLYQRLGGVYILVFGFFAGAYLVVVDVARLNRYAILYYLITKESSKFESLKDLKIPNNKIYHPEKNDKFLVNIFKYFNMIFSMNSFTWIVLVAAIFDLVYIYLGLIIAYAIVFPVVAIARIYYENKKGLERYVPYIKKRLDEKLR